MNPIEMKVAGLAQDVTLRNIGDMSITPHAAVQMSRRSELSCLHPDMFDEELIEEDARKIHRYANGLYTFDQVLGIKEMHRRYRDAETKHSNREVGLATGSGSWPPGNGCHPNLYPHQGYHATLFYTEFDQFMRNDSINREVTDEEWAETIVDAKVWPDLNNPVKSVEECKRVFSYGGERVKAHDRPEWMERSGKKVGDPFTMFDMSTWLVLEGARRVGCLYLEVFTGSNGQHNVHERMIQIPGSTAGYAYFNNGTCGDHVTSNIDSLLNYSLGRLTGLRQHELGHTKNLPHEFREPQSRHRSVMSYAFIGSPWQGYRKSGPPYQYQRDHSWDRLIRYFGDEAAKAVNGPDEPPPPPPIGNNPEVIPGVLKAVIWGDGNIAVEGEVNLDDMQFDGKARYTVYPTLQKNGFQLRQKPIV